MSPLFILAKQRMMDVLRSRSSTIVFIGLPVFFLLLFTGIFPHGHPFELKTIDIACATQNTHAPIIHSLETFPELRLKPVSLSREALMGKLRIRSIQAALIWYAPKGYWEIMASQHERLLALELQHQLGSPSKLTLINAPQWGYVYFIFPGLLTFAILFAGLYTMGYGMVRYRENSFLKKIRTTPLSPMIFVISQILGRSPLVAMQLICLLTAATLVFSLPVTPMAWLIVGCFSALGLFVFSSAGFLLACLIRTESLMDNLINAIPLPVGLLSGMFFTVDVLPTPLAKLGALLPSTMLVDAVRAAMFYHATPIDVWPMALGMSVWGIVLFGISTLQFQKELRNEI